MRAIILSFIFLFSLSVYSQESRVENCMMPCKLLQGVSLREYSVYLPKDFDKNSDKKYNVLYLLHGGGCANTDWAQFGGLKEKADSLIASGEVDEMVIVCPEGNKNNMIWFNAPLWKYEAFFFIEFMPYIEKTYRIRAEKRFRGIAGLSMGGYGTLNYALKYSEKFSACVAFSAAIFSPESVMQTNEQGWERVMKPLFGPYKEGDARLTAHYKNNNAFDITTSKGKEAYNQLRIMLDCGDDDFLTDDNCRLHIHLNKLGIKHEFRMRDGAHNWLYWRSGLPVGLKFIGESFHQF